MNWRFLGIGCLIFLLTIVGSVFFLARHYDGNVERFGDPFASIPSVERPLKSDDNSTTFLVLGSDSRISAGDPSAWSRGAQRTDAIMLMHLPADRKSVELASIPRDSWVSIPGHGKSKINAAFSWGGPSLMIRTVEQLTDVRIDHVMIADFTGFVTLTNALGGAQLGGQNLDGTQSLAYVRERHGLPRGDLDRVARQQEWVKSMAEGAVATHTLVNPLRLNKVLSAVTNSLAVDSKLSGSELRSTALSLRKISASDIDASTAPISGAGREGAAAVLYLDNAKGEQVWREMRTT